MSVKIIVAMDEDRGIGKNGQLPWHLPEDLKRFSQLTQKQPVIMGRGTAESLPKWLPNRYNIVLSRSLEPLHGMSVDYATTKVRYLQDLNQALALVSYDCWIIGGQSIYELALPVADWLYVTYVNGVFDCDRFFPDFEDEFKVVSVEDHINKKPLGFSYVSYRRVYT